MPDLVVMIMFNKFTVIWNLFSGGSLYLQLWLPVPTSYKSICLLTKGVLRENKLRGCQIIQALDSLWFRFNFTGSI